MIAAKRVLRYLQETKHLALQLVIGKEQLIGFSDSDWGGDSSDRKSTSGSLLQFAGSSIWWKCSKQKILALSTTEAEYLALTETCKTIFWMRALLKEFDVILGHPKQMFEDNQGAIVWNTDGVSKGNHVSIFLNYLKEKGSSGEIEIKYCPHDCGHFNKTSPSRQI